MKCIVECNDVEDIVCATINDCHAAYFQIEDRNGEIYIYMKETKLETVRYLSRGLMLIVRPIPPYTDKLREYLYLHNNILTVASEDRLLLQELYISYPTITTGLIEQPNSYLTLDKEDYFINFVILYFASDNMERMEIFTEKFPGVEVYFYGIRTREQVFSCDQRAHGIILRPTDVEKVKPVLISHKSSSSS